MLAMDLETVCVLVNPMPERWAGHAAGRRDPRSQSPTDELIAAVGRSHPKTRVVAGPARSVGAIDRSPCEAGAGIDLTRARCVFRRLSDALGYRDPSAAPYTTPPRTTHTLASHRLRERVRSPPGLPSIREWTRGRTRANTGDFKTRGLPQGNHTGVQICAAW